MNKYNFEDIITPEGRAVKSGSTFYYEYNLTDHLGNVRATYKDNGSGTALQLQETHFYPFGLAMRALTFNSASATSPNKYLFGGKELNSDFSWMNYDFGARNYDPAIARWHSPDPANQFVNLSPYAYCGNNPVVNVDPTGMQYYRPERSKPGGGGGQVSPGPHEDRNTGFSSWNGQHGTDEWANFFAERGIDWQPYGPSGDVRVAYNESGANELGISLNNFNEIYNNGGTIRYSEYLGNKVIVNESTGYVEGHSIYRDVVLAKNTPDQNGGGINYIDNIIEGVVGYNLVKWGQPIKNSKKFVTPGATFGTSKAAKFLRNWSKPLPKPIKLPTGTLRTGIRMSTTKTWGAAAGRIVPWVGWALLAFDVIELGHDIYQWKVNHSSTYYNKVMQETTFDLGRPGSTFYPFNE